MVLFVYRELVGLGSTPVHTLRNGTLKPHRALSKKPTEVPQPFVLDCLVVSFSLSGAWAKDDVKMT